MRKQTKIVAALSATALLALGASAVTFAAGWSNSTGNWQYLGNDGQPVVNEWKKSGNDWFYLGDDGDMVVGQLVEDTSSSKTKYYYVDANGAMVRNTWVAIDVDTDENTDLDAEQWWYYFGSDGKAYTSETPLTTSKLKTINGKKYAFNSEGRMLYGWIEASDMTQQDDDDAAWKTANYYFGEWTDGAMTTKWKQMTVDNDGDSKTYWFYFGSDGKKVADKAGKKIDGKKYNFDENGVMLEDWSKGTDSDLTGASASDISYLNGDGAQRKSTWVYAVPDEKYDEKNYNDDEYKWWYFGKDGKLYANAIKKINGKKYAFDDQGRMINKFVQDNAGTVTAEVDEGATTRDAFLGLSFTGDLYFFSADYEKDGSMQKGYVNVELSDDTYQFYFDKTSGKAATGWNKTIKKFTFNGLVIKPSNDDESNFVGVAATDTTVSYKLAVPTGALEFGNDTMGTYLVNKAGTVLVNKKNVKDSNDLYYCTDENGVVTYVGVEKKS